MGEIIPLVWIRVRVGRRVEDGVGRRVEDGVGRRVEDRVTFRVGLRVRTAIWTLR